MILKSFNNQKKSIENISKGKGKGKGFK